MTDTIFQPGAGSNVPGGGDGGDVSLSANAPGIDGDFIFYLADSTEVLRFNSDGAVIVRGEQVDDNIEVYAAFRGWLRNALVTQTDAGV